MKSKMKSGAGYTAPKYEEIMVAKLTSRIFHRPAPVGVALIKSKNEIECSIVRKRKDRTIRRVRLKIASFSTEYISTYRI
jgi:hypothetical protein